MPMKSKKQKKIYLADRDEELLKALKGEFQSADDPSVSDGFIVALGLKALQEAGGAKKFYKEGGKRGKKRQTA